MKIQNVTDASFRKYGKIITEYSFEKILKEMEHTPLPKDVVYVPSVEELEVLPEAAEICKKGFGGLPIQIGYCNGHNVLLNAVEYHRSSEINLAATDAVLILGSEADVTDDFTYETSKMEAFRIPAGTAVEVYATTLHYAPCHVDDAGFQVAVILPKGTNYPLDEAHAGGEDALLTAKNKWLIGHAEGGLPEGSHIGLIGKNLNVRE